MTLKNAAKYSVSIDPSRDVANQLRTMAKHYIELAKWLEKLTNDPKRQAEILAQLIEQENRNAA